MLSRWAGSTQPAQRSAYELGFQPTDAARAAKVGIADMGVLPFDHHQRAVEVPVQLRSSHLPPGHRMVRVFGVPPPLRRKLLVRTLLHAAGYGLDTEVADVYFGRLKGPSGKVIDGLPRGDVIIGVVRPANSDDSLSGLPHTLQYAEATMRITVDGVLPVGPKQRQPTPVDGESRRQRQRGRRRSARQGQLALMAPAPPQSQPSQQRSPAAWGSAQFDPLAHMRDQGWQDGQPLGSNPTRADALRAPIQPTIRAPKDKTGVGAGRSAPSTPRGNANGQHGPAPAAPPPASQPAAVAAARDTRMPDAAPPPPPPRAQPVAMQGVDCPPPQPPDCALTQALHGYLEDEGDADSSQRSRIIHEFSSGWAHLWRAHQDTPIGAVHGLPLPVLQRIHALAGLPPPRPGSPAMATSPTRPRQHPPARQRTPAHQQTPARQGTPGRQRTPARPCGCFFACPHVSPTSPARHRVRSPGTAARPPSSKATPAAGRGGRAS